MFKMYTMSKLKFKCNSVRSQSTLRNAAKYPSGFKRKRLNLYSQKSVYATPNDILIQDGLIFTTMVKLLLFIPVIGSGGP